MRPHCLRAFNMVIPLLSQLPVNRPTGPISSLSRAAGGAVNSLERRRGLPSLPSEWGIQAGLGAGTGCRVGSAWNIPQLQSQEQRDPGETPLLHCRETEAGWQN